MYNYSPRPPSRITCKPGSGSGRQQYSQVWRPESQCPPDPQGYMQTPPAYDAGPEDVDLFAEDEAEHVYELSDERPPSNSIARTADPIARVWQREQSARHQAPVHQAYLNESQRSIARPFVETYDMQDSMQSVMPAQGVSHSTGPNDWTVPSYGLYQSSNSAAADPRHGASNLSSWQNLAADNHKGTQFAQSRSLQKSRNGSTTRPSPEHEELSMVASPRFHPEYLLDKTSAMGPQRSQFVRGIKIVSPRSLPDRFREIFAFPNFNAIQSKCFDTVFRKNDNFVLSSPTGSGKTVIFELAICRLINITPHGQFKIVYQAPTKSLCAERQKDWSQKFARLDIRCAELTGDTALNDLKSVKTADIIITTPEKWDSMTRKWRDHEKLMKLVRLFLIDEVHMLKDDRGATLEAVISRMKSMKANVRFIALSATVPNLEDVAEWLGKDSHNPHVPACQDQFGEDFRPVLLERHVVGYPSRGNSYVLDKTLNKKLSGVIAKYSSKKPIMVFCTTRKSTIETAQKLANWWAVKPTTDRCWAPPHQHIIVQDQALRECVHAAVAFHHAGLPLADREAVENGYRSGNINVICCTSTLAVGVNLPCHFVIIKNTMAWSNGVTKEYSDLEIMQMLGRAGRPQYDTSAIAVIMTSEDKVAVYQQMISGHELLESCLHTNIIDHLNAEIALGTIWDLPSAKAWLHGTFFYVRLKRNPGHYLKGSGGSFDGSYDTYLEHLLRRDINSLQDADLITSERRISSTPFGRCAACYYVQFDTARTLLDVEPRAKLSEVLSAICQASEFKELRFKSGDKAVYREFNKSTQMRFAIHGNLGLPAHKVSIIIQSHLGGIEFPNDIKVSGARQQYSMESAMVFQTVIRLVKCYIDFQIETEDSIAMRNALMLSRSLASRCWDDSPLQLRQLEGIGQAGVRKLVSGDVKSLEELDQCNASKIEAILNRNPPYGMKLLEHVKSFPRLRVALRTVGQPVWQAQRGAKIRFAANVGFLNDKVPYAHRGRPIYVVFLAETSDGRKIFFARSSARKIDSGWEIRFDADLISPLQAIRCHVMCDDLAGTSRSAVLKPTIPSIAWSRDIVGLPDFQPQSKTRKKPSMNISAKRNSLGASLLAEDQRAAITGDIEDLADEDLEEAAGADKGFQSLDGEDIPLKNARSLYGKQSDGLGKSICAGEDGDEEGPVRLPSGNWVCRHLCKDRSRCQHQCCKTGLESRPKKRKRAEANDATSRGDSQNKKAKSQPQVQPKGDQLKDLTNISLATRPLHWSGSIAEVDLSIATPKQVSEFSQGPRLPLAALKSSVLSEVRPLPSIEPARERSLFTREPEHGDEIIQRVSSSKAYIEDDFGDWPEDFALQETKDDGDDHLGSGDTPVDASQDNDSLLNDALVGLADSQYLQTTDSNLPEAEETALTRTASAAYEPIVRSSHRLQVPEGSRSNDLARLRDSAIHGGKLRRRIQPDGDGLGRSSMELTTDGTAHEPSGRLDKAKKRQSIARMFAEEDSSSQHGGARGRDDDGPHILVHDAAARSNHESRERGDIRAFEPSGSPVVPKPRISAWLLAEFGDYVDFV